MFAKSGKSSVITLSLLLFSFVCHDTVEPLLSNHLGGVTIRSDNRRAKIIGLNGVGRVVLRSDN